MKIESSYLHHLPKPFIVVGMGISGKSIFQLIQTSLSLSDSDLSFYDDRDPQAKFNPQKLPDQKLKGTLVVSPGVPLKTQWIQNYLKSGWTLSSELSIAASFLTTEKVIGITGSIGKSTVTSLIGFGLLKEDPHCFCGGNLGKPLADYIIQKVQKTDFKPAQIVVLELSSYQLENLENLSFEVGVITYLTANHMERYDSLENYYETKWTLLSKSRHIVLNSNGGDLRSFSKSKALPEDVIWTDRNSKIVGDYQLNQNKMVGTHNVDNISIAAAVILLATNNMKCIENLKEFSGLPHRLENCGYKNEILFVNDSKSTSIQSVIEATQSVLPMLGKDRILWILLGGRDKNLPWEQASTLNSLMSLKAIYFGEVGEKAREKTQIDGPYFSKLQLALENLIAYTKPGDIVLLSPGGTSHDEFKSFEHRGDFFKNWIKGI